MQHATMKLLALLPVLLFACWSPAPPSTVALAGLDAAQQEVALDVLDAWCAATGDCPELVPAGQRADLRIQLDQRYERHHRPAGSAAFYDRSEQTVFVSPGAADLGLEYLWLTLAHEVGHHLIDGHPCHSGVMSERLPDELPGELTIDECAVAAWNGMK